MISIIEKYREEVREKTFLDKWAARVDSLRTYYYALLDRDRDMHLWKRAAPSFGDAYRLPVMHALLTGVESPEIPLTEADFAAVEDAVRRDAEAYRDRARHDLAEALHEADVYHALAAVGPSGGENNAVDSSGGKGKGKGKGKQKASPTDVDDSASQSSARPPYPAADLALLEGGYAGPGKAPDIPLFVCTTHGCRAFTHHGVLEHWQHDHRMARWTDLHPKGPIMTLMSAEALRVLALLDMPADTTAAALEARLRDSELRVRCICGWEVGYARWPYELVWILVSHH